jgi:large subunit ribosomal protein L32
MAWIWPRKKISIHKSNSRHSTWERLTLKDLSNKYNVTKCPNCGKAKLSHRVCPNCGYYKWKQVITIKSKSKDKVVEA